MPFIIIVYRQLNVNCRGRKSMPRPKQCRKVCAMPRVSEFVPAVDYAGFVVLTVDEYEIIRLIDKLNLSQQECASHMQVARSTAQQIYNSARAKIAVALVDGKGLRIEGGTYRLCDGKESCCEACSGDCVK